MPPATLMGTLRHPPLPSALGMTKTRGDWITDHISWWPTALCVLSGLFWPVWIPHSSV